MERTLRTVVANLIYGALIDPQNGTGWITVPLSKRVLGRGNRYASGISETLPDLLQAIAIPELDFVELHVAVPSGQFHQEKSRIRAGAALKRRISDYGAVLSDIEVDRASQRRGESIVLRAPKRPGSKGAGKNIDYPETEEVKKMRADADELNERYGNSDLEFMGTTAAVLRAVGSDVMAPTMPRPRAECHIFGCGPERAAGQMTSPPLGAPPSLPPVNLCSTVSFQRPLAVGESSKITPQPG
jgi:hypothetical protein